MNTKDLSERIEYVRHHIINHISDFTGAPTPALTWAALSESEWAALSGLPAVDMACGWTSPVVEPGTDHDEAYDDPIIVRFCPEIIAATTEHLRLSPEPGGDRPWVDLPNDSIECISFVDNYVRFVEHILDLEIVYWDDYTDAVMRRQAAENALYESQSEAVALISLVQSAALWKVTG